ncbi:MAG: hypothetical protein SFV23_00625 [Planctomycetaceae bacterium]|nr:hypothetical protein [Planctomycetaceae bacterium]
MPTSNVTDRSSPRERQSLEADDFVDDSPALAETQPWSPPASSAPRLAVTEFAPEDGYFSFDSLPPFPHPLRKPFSAVGWIVSLLFGMVSLVVLLAVIAAIPVVNLLALGFLLEAQGRVARTGKLRYAFPLLPLAPRLGTIVVGVWVWLFLVRIVADAAGDAATIAPGSAVAGGWRAALILISAGVAVHLVLALARGGSLWCFLRPIKNFRWLRQQFREGDYLGTANAAIRDFIVAMRLPHHFRLGLLGFIGTFLWLFLPTALFAALQDVTKPGQVLLTLFGGAVLIPVLAWTPFLQAHFAAENRLSAFRELGTIRRLFQRAPLCWFLAVVLLYALALPLYLFKIAAPPQDAMWFVTLIFVATIYPAKILIGWAYAKARQREQPTWFFFRWPARLLLLPLLAVYLFLVFFTPAIGAAGRRVLFEHHALLLPTPF